MKTLFALPWPLLTSVVAMQVDPLTVEGPGWAMAALTGVFVVLWLLNALGKLPGSNQQGDARLAKIHEVVTREDPEKPGWPMVWSSAKESRETRELLKGLLDLKERWEKDREDWARDREDWEEDKADLKARVAALEALLPEPAGRASS